MGPDLAAGKAAAFLSVTALFMSPVLIPPTREESRSFCALHTPLFPWPLGLQVGLVLGGLAHRHTPCELTVTQTRKTTDTSYPIISVTPLLTSLLLPKFLFFLFFFFFHSRVISLLLPSCLSTRLPLSLGGSALGLDPTLRLPPLPSPHCSHSPFLPHCSLEILKPAQWPLPPSTILAILVSQQPSPSRSVGTPTP